MKDIIDCALEYGYKIVSQDLDADTGETIYILEHKEKGIKFKVTQEQI